MISIKNLTYRYDKNFNLLNNVNLDINEGSMLALVGENNYGAKNLFLKLLTKLTSLQSGNIFFNYQSIKSIDFTKDYSLGYLPINIPFFKNKTVYQNLEYIYNVRDVFDGYKEKILTALKDFNIENLVNAKIKKLSNIDKLNVALCRLYLRNLDCLLIEDFFDNDYIKFKNNDEILEILDKIKLIINSNKNIILLINTNNEFVISNLNLGKLFYDKGQITLNK